MKAIGRVKTAVAAVAAEIARVAPDVVVLIDSWGFMWRLARALKLGGVRARRIKLIGPQVWATRPGRARVLAKWCDHLLCIHEFEAPFYKRYGLPVTVIGNPALGRNEPGDGARFRKARNIEPGTRIIGLLPGSRPSELKRVAPVLVAVCERLCARSANRTIVCVVAPDMAPAIATMSASWPFPHKLVLEESEKSDAFSAMDIALACSGTVTTELAVQGAALVVGYRLGWVTWAVARLFLMRSRFITLLNVAAGSEVAPEYVQTRFTAANIARAAARLLEDPAELETQLTAQSQALARMKGPGRPAAAIAAETIFKSELDSTINPSRVERKML